MTAPFIDTSETIGLSRWQALTTTLAQVWNGDDDRSQTQRAALAAFAVRVFSAGLLYLTQIAMARWMGTSDYGIYVFAWTWVLILGGLTHGGINIGVMRLLPQYRARGEYDLERGLLFYGRWMSIGLSTAIASAGGLLLFALQDAVASHYVWPLILALVCVPMAAIGEVNDGIGRAYGWMLSALIPPYILRPLTLLIVMACAHFAGFDADPMTAVGAAIAATWLSALTQWYLIDAQIRRAVKPGPRQTDVRNWLLMSLPMLAIGGSEMLLQYTDVIVISANLSPAEVGIYFASAKTMALILFVHYAVGSATAKRFASHHALGDHAALAAAVRDSVHWTFWPSLGCGALLLALGQPLLSLFGPEFVSGYGVMFILVVGYMMRAAMGPAEFLLNMAGQQSAAAAIFGATACLNIALNVTLVPMFGLYGAAVATALSTSVAAALCCWWANRKLGLSIGIWSNLGQRANAARA